MKITVIHGQLHKGSTYHVTEELIGYLKQSDTDEVYSFSLPIDGPSFCVGCFGCIYKGESNCPHQVKVQAIVSAMVESDVIVIDSPTYCLEMSGQLKTLFDHMGYMYINHRPEGKMFQKIGVGISTAAGAGAKHVTKSITKQMFWWGIPKRYRIPVLVMAKSYSEVSEKIKVKITKQTKKVAQQIHHNLGHPHRDFLQRTLFRLMAMMQKNNTWNPIDIVHWENHGWINKIRPWRV
jgi:multimeric flavodoxin WrbA